MNLLHMKYAVVIAQTNSINKAAEKLYVGQSALSRAIKELETGLGVTLFERSAKGMSLTPDGEVFVRYAKSVLRQVETIENMFSGNSGGKKRFSISVPRASYIADAFAKFSCFIGENSDIEMFYKETNSMRAIKNILQEDYKLGIVRYAELYDKYYNDMMADKGLVAEYATTFNYVLIFSKESPLAAENDITQDDLKGLVEIAHADPYVPSLPFSEVKKEELQENCSRRIFVFERASQFELLSQNPQTFMWVSPVPENTLRRYSLMQCQCRDNSRRYKDLLIRRKDYNLSEIDRLFLEQLIKSGNEMLRCVEK